MTREEGKATLALANERIEELNTLITATEEHLRDLNKELTVAEFMKALTQIKLESETE